MAYLPSIFHSRRLPRGLRSPSLSKIQRQCPPPFTEYDISSFGWYIHTIIDWALFCHGPSDNAPSIERRTSNVQIRMLFTGLRLPQVTDTGTCHAIYIQAYRIRRHAH